MRLLLRMQWCTNLKIKLNLSCTKFWVFVVKVGSSIDWDYGSRFLLFPIG